MRKIKPSQILVFSLLLSLAIGLAILSTQLLLGSLRLGDFRGIVLLFGAVVFFYF
jgi:hypothetical protein